MYRTNKINTIADWRNNNNTNWEDDRVTAKGFQFNGFNIPGRKIGICRHSDGTWGLWKMGISTYEAYCYNSLVELYNELIEMWGAGFTIHAVW